jgi:hypothetical protein
VDVLAEYDAKGPLTTSILGRHGSRRRPSVDTLQ